MRHFKNLKRPIDSPDCLDSRTIIYIEIGQARRRQSDFKNSCWVGKNENAIFCHVYGRNHVFEKVAR
jgi:hypothetical protein